MCRLKTRQKKPGMSTQCRGGSRITSITRCTSTTHFCRVRTPARRSASWSCRRRGRRTSSRRPSPTDLGRSKICPRMKSFRPASKCVVNWDFVSLSNVLFFVQSDIVIEKGKLLLRKLYLTFATDKWNSMDDVKNIYFPNQKLPKPAVILY
jgi:hypothetical protein